MSASKLAKCSTGAPLAVCRTGAFCITITKLAKAPVWECGCYRRAEKIFAAMHFFIA